jgi:hypothetical protein
VLTKAYLDCIKATIQQGWTQGHLAVNVAGEQVLPMDEGAVKFCVLGAAWKCTSDLPQYPGQEFRGEIREFLDAFLHVHHTPAPSYNDVPFRTVEQMIAALDALPVEVS